MPHLLSLSDIKGSPHIDKSYLLHHPCTKLEPIVMVKVTYKLDSHLETHSYDPTTSLFTPHDEVISD